MRRGASRRRSVARATSHLVSSARSFKRRGGVGGVFVVPAASIIIADALCSLPRARPPLARRRTRTQLAPRASDTPLLPPLPPSLRDVRRISPGGRFLKTFLVRHDEPGTSGGGGLVVVKAYLKRGSPDALSREEIETHAKNLRTSRERLLSPPPTLPHCAPFARELETDRALYLMRQYAHGTLYDRLFTRPFLSRVQKKWIAFQLLHALSECHERGVVHGDVKCENVLLTSRGWAFLADFATF